ncbi:MAG: hypothetical protein ABWY94_04180 [Pseudoxanthomonas sp.]
MRVRLDNDYSSLRHNGDPGQRLRFLACRTPAIETDPAPDSPGFQRVPGRRRPLFLSKDGPCMAQGQ